MESLFMSKTAKLFPKSERIPPKFLYCYYPQTIIYLTDIYFTFNVISLDLLYTKDTVSPRELIAGFLSSFWIHVALVSKWKYLIQ